ncbi:myb-like protein Q [Drosophila navojoa]|uniref:myb-like protein Q n=1 Tax=Drosophila navojoa TaxID=7232 RepID=UPI0011BF0C84|nr:myb-like protein Q [Drosophila navojoa]
MKHFVLLTLLCGLASCDLSAVKRPLIFSNGNWPPKSANQLTRHPAASANGKQRTLVVQIRSDQPVPLVLKGRPGAHTHAHQHLGSHSHLHSHAHLHGHAHSHAHAHLLHGAAPQHLRGARPLKLSAPVYLKPAGSLRKPLKIKLSNSKPHSKPIFGYEKPFKYEKPTAVAYSELQNLPLDTHNNYNTEHFAPIYTVPAPNLAQHHDHDNQIDDGLNPAYLPPQQQQQQPQLSTQRPQSSYYSVHEDETNDKTIRDPISGSQKLFAPDPDPSLPTTKVKIATESFNTPSNNQPLPSDVQSNHLPAQPLVQIVGAQAAAQTVPIYPIQFTQQQTTQPFIAAALPAAHIPIYNPTYLVTQSNQLYSQHKQQLFKPSVEHVVETGYVNADLTQEVASNGQILQAAKDPQHNIHPVLDSAPQYAALIAAPALSEPAEPVYDTAPFHLTNVAASVSSTAPEGGFVVSNYYGNSHDSSQLLQAYAEEEARRQQLETEQAALELQKQQQHQLQLEELHAQAQAHAQLQQQYQQELQQQQQQQYQHELQLEELKAQAQEQHLQQQQHQQQLQIHQLQQQHQQQQLQLQQQQQQQLQQRQPTDPAAAAFEEHQRLVQQQLGSTTPLRIFVPDEETPETRLQKRSDNLKKGSFEDVSTQQLNNATKDLYPVSTSVEVSGSQTDADNE